MTRFCVCVIIAFPVGLVVSSRASVSRSVFLSSSIKLAVRSTFSLAQSVLAVKVGSSSAKLS